jgi:hypothetical protein
VKEEFLDDKVPVDAAVFKDPLTAAAVLYVNSAGKAALEAIITDAGIAGLVIADLGPSPRRSRPRC